ncbi:MAG: type II secretion system F family protein [Peptoniphilaceae bacterium]
MKFQYKVIDAQSNLVTDEMDADNLQEAREKLHEAGYRIVALKEEGRRLQLTKPRRVIGKGQLALLFSQLALMSSGGLDIVTVMELMARESKGLQKEKLEFIVEAVRQGKLLSEAFYEADCFPHFVPGMIRSGEAAGTLGDIFRQLADFFDEEQQMHRKLANALAYPVILMITSLFVLQVVLHSVLPVFTDVFESRQVPLPLMTRMLIAIADHFNRFGLLYIAAFLLLMLMILLLKNHPKTADGFYRRWYHLPIAAPFYRDPFELRQLRTMKMQMDNGVDLLRIMENMNEGAENPYIERKAQAMIRGLMKGEELSAAMEKSDLFKAQNCSFVALGEASSAVSEMLAVAIHLEEGRQKNRTERISIYIEPALILLMAVVVGFIIFSIAIPMFDMVNSF